MSSDSLLIKNEYIQNLLKQELVLLILQKSLIVDKLLEKLFTKIRNELLFILIENNFWHINNRIPFIPVLFFSYIADLYYYYFDR